MNWEQTFQTHLQTNFCLDCGTILSFPALSDIVLCKVCGFSVHLSGIHLLLDLINFAELVTSEIVTRRGSKNQTEVTKKDDDSSRTTVR
jgi:hypothetical protein